MDALGSHLMGCTRGGERTASHNAVRDSVFHIVRESSQYAQRDRTECLSSYAPIGRGGWDDIVISDLVEAHILVDVVVADSTRLVEGWWPQRMRSGARKHTIVIARRGPRLFRFRWRRSVLRPWPGRALDHFATGS